MSLPLTHDTVANTFPLKSTGPLSAAMCLCQEGEQVMTPTKRRNLQIVKMCQEGKSQADVSRLLGLSPTRVYQVVRQFRIDQESARKRSQLMHDIQVVDDLDRQWPTDDLLDALSLIAVTRTALGGHLLGRRVTTLSLRELMDMLVPRKTDSDPNRTSLPILSVCGVGSYGVRSLVARITALDLGKRCKHEWQLRLTEIERSWYRDTLPEPMNL